MIEKLTQPAQMRHPSLTPHCLQVDLQRLPRGPFPTEPRRLLASAPHQLRPQALVQQHVPDAAGDVEYVFGIHQHRRIVHHLGQGASQGW